MSAPQPGRGRRRPAGLRIAILALAAVAVLIAAALVYSAADSGSGGGAAPAAGAGSARLVTAAELDAAAAARTTPIYWLGPRPGTRLELSETAGGRAYVRYLTGGAAAGDPRSAFLSVGTYRLPHAHSELRASAESSGAKLRRAPHGAGLWVDPASPTSVYLAWPGRPYEVEVYDPDPKTALALARSPRLRPVAGGG